MKVQIKNIDCRCCEMFVHKAFQALGYEVEHIIHGEVKLNKKVDASAREAVDQRLRVVGLEVISEPKNTTVEEVKMEIRNIIEGNKDPLKMNLSDHLTEKLKYNYSYISNLFSQAEGITIRDFGIKLRIEQVKRLLIEEGLDLMEISVRLNYSSVAHLAAQFKKTTGLTTTEFKRTQASNPSGQAHAG